MTNMKSEISKRSAFLSEYSERKGRKRRICEKRLRIKTKQAEDVVIPFGIFSAEIIFSPEHVQVHQYELGGLCCLTKRTVCCHVSLAHVRHKNWSTNPLLLGYYRER